MMKEKKKSSTLVENNDVLSEEGIRAFLPERYKQMSMQIVKETTSTNLLAKQAAAGGAADGMLFVAEHQTAGRGRRGRSFLSIPGDMICMSLLLKPQLEATDAVFLTTAVCVAVWRAIDKVCGIQTEIKWVNDLYYCGKKVCGILTEAVTDPQTGMVEYVIPGIGINFNVAPGQFPAELSQIAGALYDGSRKDAKGLLQWRSGDRFVPFVSRNALIAEIVEQIFLVMQDLKERQFMKEYREHSMLIGAKIRIMNDPPEDAEVLDVDENGGLVVLLTDGSRRVLSTGEVTVRKI